MTVSNFFLLMNKELFARLKSPTTWLRLAKVGEIEAQKLVLLLKFN
jgi:hypothetical protein